MLKDRVRRRLAGQTLRLGGLGLVLLSLVVLAAPGVPAYADILAPIRAVGRFVAQTAQIAEQDQTTTVEFTPQASPTPSPAPAANAGPQALQTIKGGPIRFVFSGSVTAGTQLRNQYSSNSLFTPIGASPSPSPTGSPLFPFQQTNQSSNLSQSAAEGQLTVTRRTATTYTDVSFPLGVTTVGGNTQLATVQALYSTPKYSIGYASQPLTLFGQLPMGSTLRGVEFILPSKVGQEVFYEGPAQGVDGEILRLEGVLAQAELGGNYYLEGGFLTGSGPLTGSVKTLIFGGATASGPLSVVGEGAVQIRDCGSAPELVNGQPGCDGTPHGVAYQVRVDDGLSNDGWQATFRLIPDKFVAFGSGEIDSDQYADVNYHIGQSNSLLVDANYEKTGDSSVGVTRQFIESLGLGGLTKLGSYTIGVQQQNLTNVTQGVFQSDATTTIQGQFQPELPELQTVFGMQLVKTNQDGVPGSTTALAATFAKEFRQFGVSAFLQSQRQTTAGQPTTSTTGESLSLYRQFGKTTYQISDLFQHTTSGTSNAIQKTPLFTVTRQISPVISVQASLGTQSITDKLNPGVDGHSRIFTIQLNAPFQFGSGVTTGRVDPRLPATITGHVQAAVNSANPAFASFASSSVSGGGLGNVEVVLDGRYVQRTDLTGGFQFAFISPGQHQLRVDSSSLPRGVTVSTPVVTVTLQGGQTSNVLFQVGTFGGVLGHVTGLDANGNPLPLENVQLRIDGGAYSQTDSTGLYGFGGLAPGTHTVQVIENSIPAFATFDPSTLNQRVTVVNGQYTTLNFGAQALASISGKIIYASDVADENLAGAVPNAYVVAEPGEHAAIDEDDGTFIIDNLPPGDYTVSVDTETLQEAFGAAPESIPIHLAPAEHYQGADFTVGRFEKKVVFSLLSGTAQTAAPAVHLGERRLPPQGSTRVTVNAAADAKSVTAQAFGTRIPLAYDRESKVWAGEVEVPAGTAGGDYSVVASTPSGTPPTSATLTVDPKMPLAILTSNPPTGANGVIVKVQARFLVDVAAGDRIEWEDGTVTVLDKPVSGRVFTFKLRVSLRPLHGVLLTRHGRLPIELL